MVFSCSEGSKTVGVSKGPESADTQRSLVEGWWGQWIDSGGLVSKPTTVYISRAYATCLKQCWELYNDLTGGVRGRLFQNMLKWDINYFELKLLEQLVQKGHPDPSCSLESRQWISYVRGTFPAPGQKEISLLPENENSGLKRAV